MPSFSLRSPLPEPPSPDRCLCLGLIDRSYCASDLNHAALKRSLALRDTASFDSPETKVPGVFLFEKRSIGCYFAATHLGRDWPIASFRGNAANGRFEVHSGYSSMPVGVAGEFDTAPKSPLAPKAPFVIV